MPMPLLPLPVYPAMRGLTFPITRIPMMKTNLQECISGKESAISMWSYPRWKYILTYSFLTQEDYDTIIAFFLSQRGRALPFWVDDKHANALPNTIIGYPNGKTKTFQIVKVTGSMIEPIFGTKVNMSITSGHSSLGYTITDGKVEFASAPSEGSGAITASGGYYARVRFAEDELSIDEFMFKLHELKTVELISVK